MTVKIIIDGGTITDVLSSDENINVEIVNLDTANPEESKKRYSDIKASLKKGSLRSVIW